MNDTRQKIVMGLDLARLTGFAISIDGELFKSGTMTFNGRGYSKLIELQRFVNSTIRSMDLSKVVVEYAITNNHSRNMHSKMEIIGMCAVVLALCDSYGIEYEGIYPSSLKKMFCGKGNATKTEMMAYASHIGLSFTDDNECDALALLCVTGNLDGFTGVDSTCETVEA